MIDLIELDLRAIFLRDYFFPVRSEIYNFGCAFSLVDAEKMMINAWPGERKVYGTGE